MILVFVGKGSIDKANEEVRNIILRIWPKTSMQLLDKVVQPPGAREYLTFFPDKAMGAG